MQPEGVDSLRTEASVSREDDGSVHLQQAPLAAGSRSRRTKAAATRFEQWLLRRLLAALGHPPLEVRLWSGERIESRDEPAAILHFADRSTLWKVVADPLFQFGECYSAGTLDVEGSLVGMARSVSTALAGASARGCWRELLSRWVHRPRGSTPVRSRENIHQHYDIGNDFYKLWLDENLVYTCAYFAEPAMNLEQAQVAKMDHVCRKLRLQPGETVIEAGCGWGALALHMARNYGVTVRAYNISREQVSYARRRAESESLSDRVEFIEDDWRNISGRCDAFVSVGMLEHVGPKNYRFLGCIIDQCLPSHGRGLIHSIGRNRPMRLDAWIERRIFPGAHPPELARMMKLFEPYDFSVLDVENLRLHYAETLKHWLTRFEQSADQIRAMFDEQFVRMWRLYLAGSIATFEIGDMQLFQVVFARGRNNRIPWTRAHLYSGERRT